MEKLKQWLAQKFSLPQRSSSDFRFIFRLFPKLNRLLYFYDGCGLHFNRIVSHSEYMYRFLFFRIHIHSQSCEIFSTHDRYFSSTASFFIFRREFVYKNSNRARKYSNEGCRLNGNFNRSLHEFFSSALSSKWKDALMTRKSTDVSTMENIRIFIWIVGFFIH